MSNQLPVLEIVFFTDPQQANFDPSNLPRLTVFFDGDCYFIAKGFEHLEAALADCFSHLGTHRIGSCQVAVELRKGTRLDAVRFSNGGDDSSSRKRLRMR